MHKIHNDLLAARSMPAGDGGRFYNVADQILDVIDKFKNNSIDATEYKLRLSALQRKFDTHKYHLKVETNNWLNELIKIGSAVKE